MTDMAAQTTLSPAEMRDAVSKRLKKRYAKERRFRRYGVIAIGLAMLSLAVLFVTLVSQSLSAFTYYRLNLPIAIEQAVADPYGDMSEDSLRSGDYRSPLIAALLEEFPEASDVASKREAISMVSSVMDAQILRQVLEDPSRIGQTTTFTMPISDDVDRYLKGKVTRETLFSNTPSAQISTAEDEVEIVPASVDILQDVKQRLQVDAERRAVVLDRQAELFARGDGPNSERVLDLRAQAAALRATIQAGQILTLSSDTPSILVQTQEGWMRATGLAPGRITGTRLSQSVSVGAVDAGTWSMLYIDEPESRRRVSDATIVRAKHLQDRGLLTKQRINPYLFFFTDSREPELAGIKGAFIGSLLTMLVTMLAAVPVGVMTAVYLEEFAPKNRITGFIEVNINNLAAVPSIIFGLLGLVIFIQVIHIPRGAALVGGLVLALRVLPTVIIATRASLKAVPPSIRDGARGVGASDVQTVFHHVVPLATPGIMTGSILALSQALGETAPLMLIGMVAFVTQAPSSFLDPTTVMPVQIFLWSDAAERAFEARTAAAIIILLTLMVILNLVAVIVRRKFERRW